MKRWLLLLAVLCSCGGDSTAPATPADTTTIQGIIVTGAAVPQLAAYDEAIIGLLKKYNIPGGAVAVMNDGKLIYARGFGYADVENKKPVQPDAQFRIASISKPLTAMAIMKLVEQGKLGLDDRVAPLIADLLPVQGANVDPRWEQITIRNLLNHTGGWDRTRPGGDATDRGPIAAATLGAPTPASMETIIRYMKGVPFDFDPGEKMVYSNFGYAILGVIINRLSGMPYEDYVRSKVLLPVGATRTRSGKTRLSDAFPDEVKYYWPAATLNLNWPLTKSVFPNEGTVPVNYGGFYMEAIYASGGWVSTTVDLLRFVAGMDFNSTRPDIVNAGQLAEMLGHGAPVCANNACYYGIGWFVRPTQGDLTFWHGGDLPGSTSLLVRSYRGVSWAALFNGNSQFMMNPPGNFDADLDAALWEALAQVKLWPTNDLFANYE